MRKEIENMPDKVKFLRTLTNTKQTELRNSTLEKIAAGLQIPVDYFYMPIYEDDTLESVTNRYYSEERLLVLYRQLSEKQQQAIMEYVEFLLQKEKGNKNE